MHPLRTLGLSSLTLVLLAAGEAQPMPAAVTRDIDDYRARVAKINEDADKKRAEETARIAKLLDEHIRNETKKGNLDGALAIRKLKDDLQEKRPAPSSADLLGDDGPSPPPAAGPPAAGPPVAAGPLPLANPGDERRILGTWKMSNGTTWMVKPAGVMIRRRENGNEIACTWKLAEGRITFVYENGRECPMLRVDPHQLVVQKGGAEFVGERLP